MSSTKRRRRSDMKQRLIENIVEAAVYDRKLATRKQLQIFLRTYHANVSVDDLRDRSPESLAKAALSHLTLAKTRRRKASRLNIYNPDDVVENGTSRRTVVEIVSPNMPFLVDSISMAIERHARNIHLTIHPLLQVERDDKGQLTRIRDYAGKGKSIESFARFEIDRIHDASKVRELKHDIKSTLNDVKAAVADWKKMRAKVFETVRDLRASETAVTAEVLEENAQFLEWMADDHFTFLGFKEYRLGVRSNATLLRPVKESALGVLRSANRPDRTMRLTPEMQRYARSRDLMVITKANSRSTVHRSSYLDYIGVKVFDADGNPIGERRFIGLFTSLAYSERPGTIPLLRYKVDQLMTRSGFDPQSHRGKELANILDNYPRDELFQGSVQELARTTSSILNLQDRKRVRFFLRRDTFQRFFSCLVFVPREKYNTQVRRQVESILLKELQGSSIESEVQISNSTLARLTLIVHSDTGDKPHISIKRIEGAIKDAVVTWHDKLLQTLIQAHGEERGSQLHASYADAFPMAYTEDFDPLSGRFDIDLLDSLISGDDVLREQHCTLYRPVNVSSPEHMHFKVFSPDAPLILADTMPVLKNLDVTVLNERPYRLRVPEKGNWWLQDFEVHHKDGARINIESLAPRFQRGFASTIDGSTENDGFNRLIVSADCDISEINIVRAYAKFLQQIGVPFNQSYIEDVISQHATFTRTFIQSFLTAFDPAISEKQRAEAQKKYTAKLNRSIENARSLDEDRILRAFASVLNATTRTNYFQRTAANERKPVLAIKLEPKKIEEAPLPRPQYEIFVYSPQIEGVHLRGGAVARGGIRWSDRPEDFRTEILGLMKAQTVKNTVIVPTGAKGGFVIKRGSAASAPPDQSTVIEAYSSFINGLLDLTDNIVGDTVTPPKDVVRGDADDPYLVVAADKGTAAFSDIANALSTDRQFWLQDAFASGGSAGYDHKKMGITARGAWVAVQRHLREIGVDVDKDPVTVVGIGDMSGDVFGNGMLLSKSIKLIAAFNHQHILIDPDPTPARSHRERHRLFRMKKSSWADYDVSLLSKGGGVYERSAKRIDLSKEARKVLAIKDKRVSPPDLIKAILRADVDLIWNGGVGTYVRASTENDADAGDRSNDALRITARELRCKVIGEGGNLGLTQLARIEFARNGGRINTDFIDNSAGVDSSDREVNIKILLRKAIESKQLAGPQRDRLLASMTDAVADLVLWNNYQQTQAISMLEQRAAERINEHARLIQALERIDLLDRNLEFLPDEETIDELRRGESGLSRPEIAVLLSYAKIDVYQSLVQSDLFDSEFSISELRRYFPQPLPKRFAKLLTAHRLSREIVATTVTNSVVNRMGPGFLQRMRENTGRSYADITRAYLIVRESCNIADLWRQIESLDNQVPSSTQYAMMFEISRRLRHACYWLLHSEYLDADIVATTETLRPRFLQLQKAGPGLLGGSAARDFRRREKEYLSLGVPQAVASRMTHLVHTSNYFDIVTIANRQERDVSAIARLYYEIGRTLNLHWVSDQIDNLTIDGYWPALARSRMRERLHSLQRTITGEIVSFAPDEPNSETIQKWLALSPAPVERIISVITELRRSAKTSFSTLIVALDELQTILGTEESS